MWLEEPAEFDTKRSSCFPKLLTSVRENVLGTLTTYDIYPAPRNFLNIVRETLPPLPYAHFQFIAGPPVRP